MRKPPYRVPSMPEIARMRGSAGLTAASTFSGGGGSTLGLEMAGFRVLWASEFVEHARAAHEANHPETPVDGRDIREVTAANVLRVTGLRRGELDLLEGSPPCDSFSTSGKRERLWGKEKKYYTGKRQRTDDLFMEFARLLRGLRPRAFVAENVSGLVKGVAKGYFKIILAELKRCGYRVAARVLDAQWLGVPQVRKRVIFVGVRKDLGAGPVFPRPLRHRYSVSDACPELLGTLEGHGNAGVKMKFNLGPSGTVRTTDQGQKFAVPRQENSIEGTAIGREVRRIDPGQKSEKQRLIAPSKLRKDAREYQDIEPNKPCGTITIASPGNNFGVPSREGMRKLTIAELKRICGFPDDFKLTGSYSQQWSVLGMAVPPLMMRAIAEVIRDEILLRTGRRRGAPGPR